MIRSTDAREVAVMSPGRYTAQAFFDSTSFVIADGIAWSPDDRFVYLSADETGLFNVYRVDVATGEKEALTTAVQDVCYVVSGFPEDGRTLYSSDHGGDELSHLFVREERGEVIDLTPGDAVKASFFGWSGDRRHFFVTSNVRDAQAFDLYQYCTDTYESDLIFRNDDGLILAAHDGTRRLALLKLWSNSDSDVLIHDWQGNETTPKVVTKHEGDINHGVFCFTRDREKLVYATNEHGEYQEAWSYERRSDLAADWDVTSVSHSESGRFRVSSINADPRSVVSIVDAGRGREIDLTSLTIADIGNIRFSRDESQLAVMVTSDTSPADLYLVDIAADSSQRLTPALNAAIDETYLVPGAVHRYPSYDELDIPGIMYRPHAADADNPCPALVMVQGGPGGQSRCGYSATTQHLVNHGYAVFDANNRGSSGYGKTSYHMADRQHGEADLGDIASAASYLASLDWISEEKIGVIGGSYGGYMVGAALAFRPDVLGSGSTSSA